MACDLITMGLEVEAEDADSEHAVAASSVLDAISNGMVADADCLLAAICAAAEGAADVHDGMYQDPHCIADMVDRDSAPRTVKKLQRFADLLRQARKELA